MSNQKSSNGGKPTGPEKAAKKPVDAGKANKSEKKSGDPIKRLTVIVLALSFFFLCWYLLADRYTPYTSEARVRGYVVPIAPEISGTIEEILVSNNQVVQPGDPLMRLDDETYRIAVNKARADLEDVAQSLGAGVASVAAAESALVSARTNLDYVERQAERTFELEKEGLLAQIHGDTMRTKVEQAKIAVTDAEAKLEEEKVGLGVEGEQNPRYQSSLAALQQAEIDLADTEIVAPGLGVVTNIQIAEGHFATSGTPIITFVSTKAVWIEAYMRENSLGNISPGDPVDIVLDVAPGRIFKGRVAGAGYGIDWGEKSPAGELPQISVTRGWLREPQRFPVLIEFADEESRGLRRIGGQADIIVYADESTFLDFLGRRLIGIISLLTYLN